MENQKVTNIMLDRIKYFINAIENGEYAPTGYEFTINLPLQNGKTISISDSYSSLRNWTDIRLSRKKE